MADHRAVAGAGKAAVGDQSDFLSEALADDGAGYGQHFLHSGAAFGAFVSDDYDVAGLDFAVLDGAESGGFLVEHPRRAAVDPLLVAGYLDDRAIGRQVAAEDRQSPGGTARGVYRGDHRLVVDYGYALQVLGQGAAGDGHGVAVEQAGGEEALHH